MPITIAVATTVLAKGAHSIVQVNGVPRLSIFHRAGDEANHQIDKMIADCLQRNAEHDQEVVRLLSMTAQLNDFEIIELSDTTCGEAEIDEVSEWNQHKAYAILDWVKGLCGPMSGEAIEFSEHDIRLRVRCMVNENKASKNIRRFIWLKTTETILSLWWVKFLGLFDNLSLLNRK